MATESPEAELRRLRCENRELQMRCEILKKSWHLQRCLRERFALIRTMRTDYPIGLLCAVLSVSRSGYYAWVGGRRSVRERRTAVNARRIRAQLRHFCPVDSRPGFLLQQVHLSV